MYSLNGTSASGARLETSRIDHNSIFQASINATTVITFALLSALLLATVPHAHAQTETVLYSFCSASSCADGAAPVAGLVMDAQGNLYGTASAGGDSFDDGTVYALQPPAQQGQPWTESTFFTFDGTDGSVPNAALIEDDARNFYGTTKAGGAYGQGSVFKLNSAKQETFLYSFCRNPGPSGCPDGATANSGLIQDAAGNLYGTTNDGGAYGNGTIFKIDGAGSESVLYSFCPQQGCPDGSEPYGSLIASNGTFYGTTYYGGTGAGCGSGLGCGTVFKFDNAGESVLYSFTGGSDGAYPTSQLFQDSAGNLYGTTESGGNLSCVSGKNASGCGTVFEIANSGAFSVLYTFCAAANCTDGANAFGGLIADPSGNLYSTTRFGGTNSGANGGLGGGTVFELTPPSQRGGNWTETVLYSFCSLSKCTDGYLPDSTLLRDSSGNLYGTTHDGGANSAAEGGKGGGTVFELTVGGGGGGSATLTPSSAKFPKVKVGTTSKPKKFKLINNQSITLTNISISTSENFGLSATTCGTSLKPGKKCSISVVFTPPQTGTFTGDLQVVDSASNSPQSAGLTGTGD